MIRTKLSLHGRVFCLLKDEKQTVECISRSEPPETVPVYPGQEHHHVGAEDSHDVDLRKDLDGHVHVSKPAPKHSTESSENALGDRQEVHRRGEAKGHLLKGPWVANPGPCEMCCAGGRVHLAQEAGLARVCSPSGRAAVRL